MNNDLNRGFTWEEGNYFDLLGIQRNASNDDIRRAYRQKALETHPDRFPLHSEQRTAAEARFVLLTQARDTLLNPEARSLYEAEQDTLQSLHLEALKQQYNIPFKPPPPRQNNFQSILKKAYENRQEVGSHLDIWDDGDTENESVAEKGTPQASKVNAAMFYYTQGLRYAARGHYRRAFYALSNAKMLDPELDIPAHIMNKVRLYAYYNRR